MDHLEIERKFVLRKCDLPKDLKKYKHATIEQAFISIFPCIRIRRLGDKYYLTIKSTIDKNDLVRNEYEIEISKKDYIALSKKCSGRVIKKERYFIPYKGHTFELNIYAKEFKGFIDVEVEFDSVKKAKEFVPPSWFYREVTGIKAYNNTGLSICKKPEDIVKLLV